MTTRHNRLHRTRDCASISAFVTDLALPFVDVHQDPLTLRRTLIEAPGHDMNIWPYRPILAIDCLYGSPEQREADITLLNRRYERYAPVPRQEFDEFLSAARKACSRMIGRDDRG